MPVYYQCKVCGGDHRADQVGLQFADRDSFERADLSGLTCRLACPLRSTPPPAWATAFYTRRELAWRDT
jgi:hypothetical protein